MPEAPSIFVAHGSPMLGLDFDPLLFALGAAGESDTTEEVASGFQYSNLSLTSLAFVPSEAA